MITTLKEIKKYNCIDCTAWSFEAMQTLTNVEVLATSSGKYGVNGVLFYKNGKTYKITTRNRNLLMIV